MIQIYRVYKWQLFGFFFFISICTLIKAQYAPNYQFENLDYIENEECNFKFFNTSSRKSFLPKKERKKIKAILCNNIEKNQFIDSVFSLNNIPWCFSKLPLIISNYNHNHKTQYGGAGAWGLSYISALNNGLVMNSLIDERYDFEKSTIAASKELKRLLNFYENKESAALAFITSPNYVHNLKLKYDDLFQIEAIDSNVNKVFYLLKLDSILERTAHKLTVEKQLDKSHFTITTDLYFDAIFDFKEINFYEILIDNPFLLHHVIPKDYPILLPNEVGAFLVENEHEISIFQDSLLSNFFYDYQSHKKTVYHTVGSGDVLGIIAEKYHVSVADIMNWNNLKSTVIYIGQKLQIVETISTENQQIQEKKIEDPKCFWELAKEHQISVKQLGYLNKYKSKNHKITLRTTSP
mgnify:FL=1|tara:strand:+ start:2713 stop:3936 length:1224 start_codon:yes stop_codon:yes gene_type:complete